MPSMLKTTVDNGFTVKEVPADKAKTDTAMVNEAMCKILCHNIVIVHQSHIELGIEPVFWKNELYSPGNG